MCWFIQYLLQKTESSSFHVQPVLLFDFVVVVVVVVFSTSLSAMENSGRLTCIMHSHRKSSATHSYQCVQYVRVSKQWYGCHCLGLLTCAQMLKHAIAPGIVQTPRSVRTKADSRRKIPCRTGDSNPRQYCGLAFQSDALPTELYPFCGRI